jgi:hypothetical protein
MANSVELHQHSRTSHAHRNRSPPRMMMMMMMMIVSPAAD